MSACMKRILVIIHQLLRRFDLGGEESFLYLFLANLHHNTPPSRIIPKTKTIPNPEPFADSSTGTTSAVSVLIGGIEVTNGLGVNVIVAGAGVDVAVAGGVTRNSNF